MVMEEPPEINPPCGRVSGQELMLIPISESRRRRNNWVFAKRVPPLEFSGDDINICQRGAPGVAPLAQAARGHAPLGAPYGRLARGAPSGALLASRVFRRKRFLGIFLEFSEHFYICPFSAMHGQ